MIGLDFAAPTATDRIDVADSATTTTALWQEFTVAAWLKMRSDADPNFIFVKLDSVGAHTHYLRMISGFNAFIARASSNCEVQTNTSQYTLDVPIFVALTFNAAGAAAADTVNIYVGYPDTPVVEVAYTARIQGSGAATAATGTLIVGNRSSPYSKSLDGVMYDFCVVNQYLSIESVEALRLAAEDEIVTPNTALYYPMGLFGTATQYDISGNGNDGAITGAALGDSAVSRPMPVSEPYYLAPSSPATARQIVFRRAGRFV